MKFVKGITAVLGVITVSACAHQSIAQETQVKAAPKFTTQVLSRADADKEEADWGTFIKYFEGRSDGTDDVLSGIAEIKPGFEIHPPHRHGEEEYLMVLEGNGTWSVNGETFAAGPGDMLYADPWDVHGIRNTGETVLTFVFWKARPAGSTAPIEAP